MHCFESWNGTKKTQSPYNVLFMTVEIVINPFILISKLLRITLIKYIIENVVNEKLYFELFFVPYLCQIFHNCGATVDVQLLQLIGNPSFKLHLLVLPHVVFVQ